MKLDSKCPSKRLLPTAEEKENGKHYIYWACPIKLVPAQIVYWYQMYNYEISFPGVKIPSFQKRKRRYLLCWMYYTNKLSEYQKLANQRQRNKEGNK